MSRLRMLARVGRTTTYTKEEIMVKLAQHGTPEDIAFSRMCTVTQTVFSCPACYLRMVIFPKGEVPIDSSTTEVVVGPPAEGFHIAKV